MSNRGLLLGVDGGNTKTVAAVVAPDGTVIGAARGGCSDVYALSSVSTAVSEISATCRAALSYAGANPADLDAAVYSLAGADWPEDIADLTTALSTAIASKRAALVCNDGIGALWSAFGNTHGVVATCGTYVAVAARGPAGQWHASFWAEPAGAVHLGQAALDAVYRAELGTGNETMLSCKIMAALDLPDASAVLHHFTNRHHANHDAVGRLASLVLDSAEEGDSVADRIVDAEARAITTTVDAAARRTKLKDPYPLALMGGVLTHASSCLPRAVESLAAGRYVVQQPRTQPVIGTVQMAAHQAHFDIDLTAVLDSIPMFDDLPDWRAG